MWVELESGDYANLSAAVRLETVQDGSDWKIEVDGSAALRIAGVAESTQAQAQDIARRLVHGVAATSVT